MLGDVFIPVLEAVSEAPPTSPLRDADLTQIADFLVHLSGPQEPNVRTHARNTTVHPDCDDIHRKTQFTIHWPWLWLMLCCQSQTTAY